MVFYLIKFVFSLEHIIGVRSKHCLKVWMFDVFHSIYRVIYRAKYSKFYLDRTPIIWWLSEKKIVHFGNQYGSRSHKIHNLNKFILDLDVLSTIFLMISFLFYFFFSFHLSVYGVYFCASIICILLLQVYRWIGAFSYLKLIQVYFDES